jgi:hypothetical protein
MRSRLTLETWVRRVITGSIERLLDHIVEPCVFERGEQPAQRRGGCLRPRLCLGDEADALAFAREGGGKLPIAAVEDQDAFARLQAQDVAQIVLLRLVESDGLAFGQVGIDVQANRKKIICGHGEAQTSQIKQWTRAYRQLWFGARNHN